MDLRTVSLTKRERELLRHVWLGRRTAEIARIEGIAVQTVANRLQEARHKLGGVDRRTAALILAEAEGWEPGIKPTPSENTLFPARLAAPDDPVEQSGEQADRTETSLQRRDALFVGTIVPEQPGPLPQAPRRNQLDATTRISMLMLSTSLLLVATFAFLWVYGKI